MADEIRLGIIGCDTSHCTAFTRLLHDEKHKDHVPGARVVAACPTFSPDLESSVSRYKGYTAELRDRFGVKIVDTIEQLVTQCDAVLLHSVDGRRHRRELAPVVRARKPIFIDKPFAASLEDARAMVKMLKDAGVPGFGCSSLRFERNLTKTLADKALGRVLGCQAYSPAWLEPTNPGLFWYGVHGVEILYTAMGPGCQSVRCVSRPDVDLAVGVWKDGRVGTMRGSRKGHGGYGALLFSEKQIRHAAFEGGYVLYAPLLKKIVAFFRTGHAPPVSLDETLEIMAFIDAALRSAKQTGAAVNLEE